MIRSYLLITLRSMMKNKLFVIINVLGLGLATAVCIVAFLNWKFSNEWDSQHTNADNVYRIQSWRDGENGPERFAVVPLPLANNLEINLQSDEKIIRFIRKDNNFRIRDDVFQTAIAYSDSSFFDAFTLPLLSGDVNDFRDKNTLFISDELALRYFGKTEVTGEIITQIIEGKPREFRIGAVFKDHKLNSSFNFDAITQWANTSDIGLGEVAHWYDWNTTMLILPNPERVTAITREMQKYVTMHNDARQDFKIREFYLDNFKGIATRSTEEPRLRWNQLKPALPKVVVDVPSIMACLLLLLACFNFTNTSISLAGQRLKEIGIRKVIGGQRKQLIIQFLAENLVLCFLSLLVGLLIAELLVPAYDHLWPWLELDLDYSENASLILFLAALLFLTAILAGSYSAFYITGFEPIQILKGKSKFGGTSWLTRILLSAQFSISVLTIVFGIGFYNNANYQKNYDLGYYTSGVISVDVQNQSGFETYRDAIQSNSAINTIAGTRHHLINWFDRGSVRFESEEHETDIFDVGENYLTAMNIRLLEGRDFDYQSESDRRESIIVTEQFTKQFHWKESAIGKRIIWRDTIQLYVIGVAKDIYSRALFRPLEPAMIRCVGPEQYTQLVVSVDPNNMLEVNEFMKEKWKAVFPNVLYNGQFIDNKMQETLETNYNGVIIFSFLGFFAALMSATGLFTLVSLHIVKKTKEIGIRKVMGAPVMNILRVIGLQFVLIILIAAFIGGAIGYVMVDISMDAAWEYYEKVTVTTFLLSAGIIFTLALVTVGFKTFATATMNPVKTLRDE
jgi:putative ABC transport system permease protein